jgi:hypothetical protein
MRPGQSSRELEVLAAHFGKLAKEAKGFLAKSETLERLLKYFSESGVNGSDRLLRLAPEMSWAAEALCAVVAHNKVIVLRTDSPNPQVRLALYIVGWLEASTGTQQYTPLSNLIYVRA